jgi:hypothetical protein
LGIIALVIPLQAIHTDQNQGKKALSQSLKFHAAAAS